MDDNVDDALASVCSLYGIGEKDDRGIDDASHSLFVKAKCDIDVLPPSHGALKLHITKPNYQVKICLQADYVIMDLENKPTETIDLWQEGQTTLKLFERASLLFQLCACSQLAIYARRNACQ